MEGLELKYGTIKNHGGSRSGDLEKKGEKREAKMLESRKQAKPLCLNPYHSKNIIRQLMANFNITSPEEGNAL